jgi:hypothetical protein
MSIQISLGKSGKPSSRTCALLWFLQSGSEYLPISDNHLSLLKKKKKLISKKKKKLFILLPSRLILKGISDADSNSIRSSNLMINSSS